MTTSSDQWFMPKRWPWIEYPVGWLQQLAWIANASWPGDDDFKQLQGYIIHARLLVREIHWSDHLGGGNKRWPSIEYTPLGGISFVLDDMVKPWSSEYLAIDVAIARSKGHSWTEIGAALGVSRTAAHKRFSRTISMEQVRERGGRIARWDRTAPA
jgi:hypothetical protein